MLNQTPMSVIRRSCLPFTIVVLTACSGGGGDDDDPAPNTTGTNGLPFGEAGQTLEDAEGVELSTTMASYNVGLGASLNEGQFVQIDSGTLDGAFNGEISVNGERITISDSLGVTSDGNNVQVFYEPMDSGIYAGAVDVLISDGTSGAQISENAFVFGFETSPDAIAGRTTGTLTYVGGYQASGSLGGEFSEFDGTMTLTADFDGAGSVAGELSGEVSGGGRIEMSFGSLDISGSGFSGDIACDSGCSGVSAGEIAGAFYGPDAEEVGGVLAFEFEDDTSSDDFAGAGTFVLTDPEP